ncbi:MAG: hypothetical protein KGH57_01560 [Candidatus Micrarchaeota archaeon]|nr:hypothetical protein [Candidatus Micrarchaeota archaeon]
MAMEAVVNNKADSTGALTAEVQRMSGSFYRIEVLFGIARQSGIKEFSSSVADMQGIFRKLAKKDPRLMEQIRIDRTSEFTTNLHSSSDLEELMVGGYWVPLHRLSENRWEIHENAEVTAEICAVVGVGRPIPEAPLYMQKPVSLIVRKDYKKASKELIKELKRRQ